MMGNVTPKELGRLAHRLLEIVEEDDDLDALSGADLVALLESGAAIVQAAIGAQARVETIRRIIEGA